MSLKPNAALTFLASSVILKSSMSAQKSRIPARCVGTYDATVPRSGSRPISFIVKYTRMV